MLTDNIITRKATGIKIAVDNGSIQKHDLSVAASTDQYHTLSLGFLDRDGIQFRASSQPRQKTTPSA